MALGALVEEAVDLGASVLADKGAEGGLAPGPGPPDKQNQFTLGGIHSSYIA